MQAERLARARISLEGLSVADSLGGFFEGSRFDKLLYFVTERKPPSAPWHYTDDTNMALSIFAILRRYGEINQDQLALDFAQHYERGRGYGPAMHRLLPQIQRGIPWREATSTLFGGQGSFGNGSAMRVAPVGAYFADDLDGAVENARRSAEITHSHPEGIAGAIAITVAAAYAWRLKDENKRPSRPEFIDLVLPHIPESEVKSGCRRACDISADTAALNVALMIGNGSRVSAQDTVPFVLWSAGEYLDNYEEAFWQTASVGGDVDTSCAMVGGIVACYTRTIPPEWVEQREPLPKWALETAE